MYFHASFLLPVLAHVASVACAPSASSEPCAQVSATLANKHSPVDSFKNVIIDPDTALACLQSVPVDKKGDLLQLEGLQTVLNFQSDLAYQKNPTPGFLYPAVDLLASIDAIIAKVKQDAYKSEYDVQLDILQLVNSGYDFHLVYRPDITQVFSWFREANLVSLSTTNGGLPDVYVSSDLESLVGLNKTGYKASPVAKINGTDTETWLNQYAALNPYDHDPDTNYNNLFINIPLAATQYTYGTGSSFSLFSSSFPGRVTMLSFANGSTLAVGGYATIPSTINFKGITDGSSFFKAFCSGPPASASSSGIPISPSSTSFSAPPSGSATANASQIASSSAVTTNNIYTPIPTASSQKLPNYPEALEIAPDLSIAGYFPEAESDLLVITIPTFGPSNDYIFQNKIRSFLATAKAHGRKRLILDIRGNGGGNVVDGYSLFTELFPSKAPFALGEFAAWPLTDAMGQVASTLQGSELNELASLSTLSFTEDLTVSNTEYDSWSDFYGPVQHHGGNFTNVRRYNFSSPYSIGEPIYGYPNDTRPQPQTFLPENIVLLSDGFCGSTCALFSELMKTQAGVKAITVGGRKQYCAMQSVGGSKGSNDQNLETIGGVAFELYQNATAKQKALFEPYFKAGLEAEFKQVLDRRASWNPASNVNWMNNLRKDDSSATPLMFVYEASNCRFFYTPQMIFDQSLVWSQTYNLQWGNATCIKGSTGEPSAQTGFSTDYILSAPPSCAKNFFGADLKWSYAGYGASSSSTPSTASQTSLPSGASTTTGAPPGATSTGAASNVRVVTAGGSLLVALSCGLLF